MIALVSFLVMIGLMLFNVPIALCTGFAAITGIMFSKICLNAQTGTINFQVLD